MRRFLRDWGPALLWTFTLFALSSRPTLPADLGGGLDKVAHFGAYSLLGILLAHGQVRTGMAMLSVMVLGVLIGAFEEVYQGFVPGRATELGDWVADSLGVVTGVTLYNLWHRRRADRSAPPRSRTPEPARHE